MNKHKYEKPKPEQFGYQSQDSFDTESGWMIEDGEEKYYEALKKWQEAQDRMQKRFSEFDNCETIEQLGLTIWPLRAEEYSCSAKRKRTLFIEWCGHFKNGTKCPNFAHKNPKELAEDIWKPNWDEEDGLFQGLREHLIKNIYKVCKHE